MKILSTSSSSSSSSRIDYVDAIKGFSILWVVIYHFQVLPEWINVPYRMPLFFLMSGIFFRERNSFKEFIVKKINTLIIPFCFFYLLALVFYIFMSTIAVLMGGNFGFNIVAFFQGILKLFTLIPITDENQNPLGVGAIWFLMGLFNIQFLYYGLRKISRSPWFLLLVSLVLYFAGNWLDEYFAMGSLWYWIYSLQFVIYYVLGSIIGNQMVKFLENTKLEIVITLICLIMLVPTTLIDWNIAHDDILALLRTISFICVVFVVFKNIHNWKLLQPLRFFGRNSIVVLGTHVLFLALFHIVVFKLYNRDLQSLHWLHLVLFLLICLGNYYLILLFNKYIPTLIGKKSLIRI